MYVSEDLMSRILLEFFCKLNRASRSEKEIRAQSQNNPFYERLKIAHGF